MRRRSARRRALPPALAAFTAADWLGAPPTDAEAAKFGDERCWLGTPALAAQLRWSLAVHRWEEARLAWAAANLAGAAWAEMFCEALAVPLYTRPVW